MNPSEKQTIKKTIQETRDGESPSPSAASPSPSAASLSPSQCAPFISASPAHAHAPAHVHAHAPAALPTEFAVGSVIADGRYQIISTLGRGAFGCVYEVEQTYMKKRLAMKLLLPGQTSDYDLKRFQKEAQAASRLDHPNLVHAVDFGMLGGSQPYMVMELVKGTTLENYIKENGPMTVDLAIDTFIPVCLALNYAHQEGVVHRDLKPTNIILEGKSPQKLMPKIIDFGIAKLNLQEETALTQIGEVLGTPLYMSPEQCAGEPIDFKTDIYSLGCVIFESLTGTPPFSGKSSLATMLSHRDAIPPSLKEASMGFGFPSGLETMMAKMLAKNSSQRYSSCMEIAQDFEYLKRGEFEKIEPINQKGTEAIASRKNGKLGVVVISAVLALALLLVAGVFVTLPKPPGASENLAPEDLGSNLHFADVKEGSFCHTANGQRIYAFPNDDVIGMLYWWQKNASEPGQHPAQGVFNAPGDARPLFELGWTVIAQKGTYLSGFVDDFLSGAFINIRANWEALGNDDALTKALKLLENQSGSLRILELITKQTEDFSFTRGQLNSLNKLTLVQWLLIRNRGLSGQQLVKLGFFPRLKVLGFRRIADCSLVLDKLRSNKNIQRLSIFECRLSEDDLHNLSQLRTLRFLEVRQLQVIGRERRTRSDLLEHVAKLPNLQQLCIDTWNVKDEIDQKQLTKMKKLKVLSIADVSSIDPSLVPEMMRSIQAKLPDCKVELIPFIKDCTFREWCDPVKTNPDKVITWE